LRAKVGVGEDEGEGYEGEGEEVGSEDEAGKHGGEDGGAAEGEGRDWFEGEVAGYGGEEGRKTKPATPRAKPRGWPKVGKVTSKKSSAGEPSSTRAFVGPATAENGSAALGRRRPRGRRRLRS